MAITGAAVCAGGKPRLKFTYSGDYVVRDDGVVELLTSGILVFLEPTVIDVFMVGGGGSGYSITTTSNWAGPGGGGGYTRTIRKVNVNVNTEIPITIGAGGETPNRSGGASGFNTLTVDGGKRGEKAVTGLHGGDGGSGGGGGVMSNSDYGVGGSDGNNGESGYPLSSAGGKGQGFSTREFGEATGKLYAGGGGGGRYMSSQTPIISSGGAGGGGSGAWQGTDSAETSQASAAGVANTGGGGGGGAGTGYWKQIGASGGSGIVCFREAQELPELAGTWVLNERLYPSQTGETINENISFTAVISGGKYTGVNIVVGNATTDKVKFYKTSGDVIAIYTYSTNGWTSDRVISQITFPAGATASNEFRAWLASNATKQ